jgi:hypothetical protein
VYTGKLRIEIHSYTCIHHVHLRLAETGVQIALKIENDRNSGVLLIFECVLRQVEHYRKKLLRKALEDTAAPSPPPPPQRKEKSTRHEEPDSDYSSSRSSKKEKRKKKQRDRSSSGKTDNLELTK